MKDLVKESWPPMDIQVSEKDKDPRDRVTVMLRYMLERGDMVVGFGTEWHIEDDKGPHGIAMLKLCTNRHCLLVRVGRGPRLLPESVRRFLAFKDAIFVGVHIKDDLERLRRDYGVEVRNAVELSELAANVKEKPALAAFGCRELADKLGIGVRTYGKVRSVEVVMSDWGARSFSSEQAWDATIDAYEAYRVGKHLLDN